MRSEGWEVRLFNIIDMARIKPYELGSHDCFRVACKVVEALTGVDRWPEFVGYTTRREALELLAKFGSTFELAMDKFFGSANIGVKQARRGDICCVESDDGDKHLGVCLGRDTAYLSSDGLIYIPTISCLCAWRVG